MDSNRFIDDLDIFDHDIGFEIRRLFDVLHQLLVVFDKEAHVDLLFKGAIGSYQPDRRGVDQFL